MDLNFFWETDYQRVSRKHNDRKKVIYTSVWAVIFTLCLYMVIV